MNSSTERQATTKTKTTSLQARRRTTTPKGKRRKILFIRHGQTYMNEHIGVGSGGVGYGSPNFTDTTFRADEYGTPIDVDDDPIAQQRYYDSPLSDVGIQQAQELRTLLIQSVKGDNHVQQQSRLEDPNSNNSTTLDDPTILAALDNLDSIIVSPLTRALQTLDIGLYPFLQKHTSTTTTTIPIIAVPQASERIYLISDIGTSPKILQHQYPYVDFQTAFDHPSSNDDSNNNIDDQSIDIDDQRTDDDDDNEIPPWYYSPTPTEQSTYVEWRPHGQGQKYKCYGEPQHIFDQRMSKFYFDWLLRDYDDDDDDIDDDGTDNDNKSENTTTSATTTTVRETSSTIAVVCHAGVIDWFTQRIFQNCEVQLWDLEDLTPRNLLLY